jgi:protein O-GlcNAc transferase
VTCIGDTFAGRVAASLLTAAGLPELITRSIGDYEELAFKLAQSPGLLRRARARLLENRGSCPLFDTPRYARNLESAYTTMFERHDRGLAPESFTVVEGRCSGD